jgi:sugar lactone lactonase YvrE
VVAANRLRFTAARADRSLPAHFGEATVFIDGAPVTSTTAAFYVTFSGEASKGVSKSINNVVGYTAAGDPLPSPVLAVPGSVTLSELRGMAFDAQQNLYVANAHKSESMILAFGAPGPDGTRSLLGTGPFSTDSPSNPGLVHPYGLAFDPAGNLLVSSQDTFVVTRLGADGTPTAVAPGLQSAYPGVTFLPGTVVPADAGSGPPPPEPTGLQAPRGIAVDSQGTLYAADNAAQKVRAYDATTGVYKGDVLTKDQNDGNPVGLLLAGSTLYVTSEGTDNVMAVNLSDNSVREVVKKTTGDVSLDHPSGIALGADGALYVASRVGRQILRFDLAAGTGSVFVDKLGDEPEQLIAVPG